MGDEVFSACLNGRGGCERGADAMGVMGYPLTPCERAGRGATGDKDTTTHLKMGEGGL
jgi:hypothetical protein